MAVWRALRWVLLILVASLGSAAAAPPRSVAADEAVLEIWSRPIVVLRATVGTRSPKERAAYMADRIASLGPEMLHGAVTTSPFESGQEHGVELSVAGLPVVRLYPEDLDPLGRETLEEVAELARQRLAKTLAAQMEQFDARALVRGILTSLGATGLFALLVTGLARSRRFVVARLYLASEKRVSGVTRMGFDVRRHLLLAAKYAVDLLAWGLIALLSYLWLTFVFVQFPYSAPWGERLGSFLLELAGTLTGSLLNALPDFFTVVVILGVTRVVTVLVTQFFATVSAGRIRSAWLEPETAVATRRIAIGLIWLFALTAAFPFIPGSESAAFRGIGVLAGLMLSLGSASVVSQAMSGLVVVYSRAFQEGDYVRIGEVEGSVTKRGALSTKVRNVRGEEVTLPNVVVANTPTVNFTRLASGRGAALSATVTIGYDTPWRQVNALLELAARRTEGVRAQPAPRVVQRALSDFYVEYQLVAEIERSSDRPLALSRLHAAIQDVFNEHGVQIMSPHFRGQPDAAVVVPPERWYEPPAEPASGTVGEPRRTG